MVSFNSPLHLFLAILNGLLIYFIGLLTLHINVLWICFKVVRYYLYYQFLSPVDPRDKAVFITGSESGFGFKLAQILDAKEFTVFAGCLSVDDGKAEGLRSSCSSRLKLVKCDVNSDRDVDEAVYLVKSSLGDCRLWALVNNAGVGATHPLDWGKSGVEIYEFLMKTNAIGPVRVTKGFLPLLRQTKGSRVILMSSILAKDCPSFVGSYAMSKAALSSFGNSLRRTLKPWEVYVSIIEPAGFVTTMFNEEVMTREMRAKWEETPDEVRKQYGDEMRDKYFEALKYGARLSREDWTPVLDAMNDAVTSPHEPQICYEVVSQAQEYNLQMLKIGIPEFSDLFFSLTPFTFISKVLLRIKMLCE